MPCHSTGELLEPFPTERRISTLLRKLPLRQRAQVPQSVFSSSTSCSFSSSPLHAGRARRSSSLGSSTRRSFSADASERGGLDASGHSSSSGASLSDYSSSRYDRIAVASVAGDSGEFKRFQADLRRTRMVTGAGAKQVMGRYIESRSRSVEEARRRGGGELHRIKILLPTPPPPSQQRRFSNELADRICDAFKQATSSNSPAAARNEDHLPMARGLGARGASRSFSRLEHCLGSTATNSHTRSSGLKGGNEMFNLQARKEDSIPLRRKPWIAGSASFDIKGFKSESFRSKRHDMIASGML